MIGKNNPSHLEKNSSIYWLPKTINTPIDTTSLESILRVSYPWIISRIKGIIKKEFSALLSKTSKNRIDQHHTYIDNCIVWLHNMLRSLQKIIDAVDANDANQQCSYQDFQIIYGLYEIFLDDLKRFHLVSYGECSLYESWTSWKSLNKKWEINKDTITGEFHTLLQEWWVLDKQFIKEYYYKPCVTFFESTLNNRNMTSTPETRQYNNDHLYIYRTIKKSFDKLMIFKKALWVLYPW